MKIDHLLLGLGDQVFQQLVVTVVGWTFILAVKALHRRLAENARRARSLDGVSGKPDQPPAASRHEHPGPGHVGERVDRNIQVRGGDSQQARVGEQERSAVGDRYRRRGAAAPEPSVPGWWRRWDAVGLEPRDGDAGDEAVVREIGPDSGDRRPRRRLACVAPAHAERPADRLLWTAGDGAPSPFSRHLAHAAALRYQVGVYDGGAPAHRLRDEIGRLFEELASAAAAAALLAGPGVGDARRADPGRADRAAAGLASVAAGLPGPGSPAFTARDRAAKGPLAGGARHAPTVRKAVIFTALGVEYQAIRAYLGDVERREEHGMLYEVGTLPGIRGSWQLALAETGPGSTAAGLQLDRAVRVFDPEIAIYLGVAGGRKDVTHGDVVVADAVYDYEPGKSTLEGFEPRMRTHSPAHRLLQWARLVAREKQWQRRILPACPDPPPACYVKPIVTGAKVIAHDRSQAALLLRQYAGDAVAVETEGHGFLEAASVNPRVDALVIRGISDLLTGKDKQGGDYWQPAASRHAAAFAIEFLDSIGGNEA